MQDHVTLHRPDDRAPGAQGISSSLPTDLLGQSAQRLRILALLYAFVFFMAGVFPLLLVPADLALFLSGFAFWGPTVIAIVFALLVATVLGSKRLSLAHAMTLGLAFEIIGAYGIAIAEFTDPLVDLHGRAVGQSWVAVWTVLFTVVVPTRPRRTLLAALATVSSVPVVVGFVIAYGHTGFHPDPGHFFFWLVLPSLLVVTMAYVGARVVYQLGTEVKRAPT